MHRCCRCNDPAVRAVTTAAGTQPPAAAHYYCNLHHAEEGFSEPACEKLQALAARLGYSLNAILFLADARQSNAKLCHNAMGCCIAVWLQAERYFGDEAGQALRAWGIRSGQDIAAILFGLLESGLLSYGKGESAADFAGLRGVGDIP
jgi:hypothetical protein